MEVEYEYDVHPPEPPEPNPYTTWSNRLMKYGTYLVTPAQQEMGVLGDGLETLGGGFFPPGELRTLQSTTYYYYNPKKGNVEEVVTEVPGSDDYSAVRLSYAHNGRAVSFVLGETWKWDRDPEHAPTDYHVTWAREFRYDGARQRYLNRQLDATALEAGSRVALSDVWSDYDGNAIYVSAHQNHAAVVEWAGGGGSRCAFSGLIGCVGVRRGGIVCGRLGRGVR